MNTHKIDDKKTTKQLAEEHWDWVAGLLEAIREDQPDDKWLIIGQNLIRYLYTTAFVHGAKHAQENKINTLVIDDDSDRGWVYGDK